MARRIEVDGIIHEFPDDATDEEISSALSGPTAAAVPVAQAALAPKRPTALRADGTIGVPFAEDVGGGIPGDGQPATVPDTRPGTGIYGIPLTNQGTTANDFLRLFGNLVEGANEGIATIAGMPVELMNRAPQLINLLPGEQGVDPISSSPVGGVNTFMDLFDAIGATGNMDAVTTPERVSRRVGQEVGANVIPQMGLTGRAMAIGGRPVSQMGALDRSFVAPFIDSPVAANVTETLTAAGAGLGAQTAREVAGDSPTIDLAGGLAGGVGTGLLTTAAGSAKRAAGDVFDLAMDKTSRAARNATGRKLAESAIDPDKAFSGETLAKADDIADAVPGVQATTGQASGDPGLLALEYSRSRGGPNVGAYAMRGQDNNAAVNQAIEDAGPAVADDAATRAALEGRRKAATETADRVTAQRAAARDVADTAADPGQTPQQAGRTIRGAVEGEVDRLANLRDEEALPLLRAAEESGATVDARPVRDLINQKLEGSKRPQIISALKKARAALKTPKRDEAGKVVRDEAGNTVMVRDTSVSGLYEARRRINDLIAGRGEDATTRFADKELAEVRDALDDAISKVAPEYGQYLDSYRAGSERIDPLRAGAPGAVTARDVKTKAPKVPDSEVAAQFWNSGKGNTEALQSFERATGGSAPARAALRDYALADARKAAAGPDGTIDPRKLDGWIAKNREKLAAYPDVERDLGSLSRAEWSLRAAQERAAMVEKGLNNPRQSTIARYLSGEDAAESMGKILKGGTSRGKVAEMENLVRTLKGNPTALEGAQRAFWDLMERETRSTAKDAADNPLRNKAAFNKFLNKNDAAAKVLFRDSPSHLKRLREIADTLDVLQRTSNAKMPGSSGTGQSARGGAGLTVPGVLSRIYGIERGVVSPRFVASELTARVIARAVSRFQGAAVDELLDEALLDPKTAKLLVTEFTKENERQLTRDWDALLARFGARAARTQQVGETAEERKSGPLKVDIRRPEKRGPEINVPTFGGGTQ